MKNRSRIWVYCFLEKKDSHLSCNRVRKQIFKRTYKLNRHVHSIISLSLHEQICLVRLCFEIYFSHYHDGRSISRNVAALEILVHDVINLLYYEHWTDKQNYFYLYMWVFNSPSTSISLKSVVLLFYLFAQIYSSKALNNAKKEHLVKRLQLGKDWYVHVSLSKCIEIPGWL